MTTITVFINGSGLLSDQSKSYTISDADLQSVFNWAPGAFNLTGTNSQLFLAWVQSWIDGTIKGVQQSGASYVVPPPISIT